MRLALLSLALLALAACDSDSGSPRDVNGDVSTDTSSWCTSDDECGVWQECLTGPGLCRTKRIPECGEGLPSCPSEIPVCDRGWCAPE